MRNPDGEVREPAALPAPWAGQVHPFVPPPGQPGMGPDDLRAAGLIGEAVPQAAYLQVLGLVAGLRARREAMGLSLAAVSDRSGLTRRAIIELEEGRAANPTMKTLYRYALALDAGVTLRIEEMARADERGGGVKGRRGPGQGFVARDRQGRNRGSIRFEDWRAHRAGRALHATHDPDSTIGNTDGTVRGPHPL